MAMTDGMKQWAGAAVDTMDETARNLISKGVDPIEAVKASAIITKQAVFERIDHHFANQNAAIITNSLSEGIGTNKLQ